MIKVVHISNKAAGGGAEIVFCNTVLTLARHYNDQIKSYTICEKTAGLPINVDLDLSRSGKKGVLSNIYAINNYKKILRFLCEVNPDIIHLQHYANLSPSVLHAIYTYKRKNKKTRVIQTTHTFERVCSNTSGYDYRKKKRCIDCAADRYKYKVLYRACSRGGVLHSLGKGITSLIADFFYNKKIIDQVITPSDFLNEITRIRLKDTVPIQTIRNPLGKDFLTVATVDTIKEDLLVYYGRISEEKNLSLLIETLSIYKERYTPILPIKLKIIGDGSEKERLIAMARDMGVGFIEFMPFLSQKELVNEIGAAKIAVMPSKCFESFALLVLEAITQHILPIAPAHGGMREAIERYGCGLTFKSDDASDLADKIYYGINNYDKLILEAKNALELITHELNENEYGKQIVDLYMSPSSPDAME